MSGKIGSATSPADPLLGTVPRPVALEAQPVGPAQPPEPIAEADLRLIIEEDEKTGGYVYTIVDRRSGHIVSRLPREEVLRMRNKSEYAAGAVFNGKA